MEDNRNKVEIKRRVAPKKKSWITGTGQTIVNVHDESEDCRTYGCVIHNPSENCMSSFPTHWRTDRGIMERICPHGIGHPDHDSVAYWYRLKGEDAKWNTVHGCDGCCQKVKIQ